MLSSKKKYLLFYYICALVKIIVKVNLLMIKALDPKFNSLYKSRENHKVDKKNSNSASFGSGMNVLTVALQACEQHPMLGVTAIDATTCIVPRAAVDFNTNAHAGLETFRRESSGLFVNCLLPSFFVYGIANVLKPFLSAAICAAVAFLISLITSQKIVTIIAIVVAIFVYIVMIFLTKTFTKREILSIFNAKK